MDDRLTRLRELVRESAIKQDAYAIMKGGTLKAPILGKTLEEVEYKEPYRLVYRSHWYTIKKGADTVDLYVDNFDHKANNMWIITKNGVIVYLMNSHIFAPASSAFHIITGVLHGYDSSGLGSWEWLSTEPATAIDELFNREIKIKVVKELPEGRFKGLYY